MTSRRQTDRQSQGDEKWEYSPATFSVASQQKAQNWMSAGLRVRSGEKVVHPVLSLSYQQCTISSLLIMILTISAR